MKTLCSAAALFASVLSLAADAPPKPATPPAAVPAAVPAASAAPATTGSKLKSELTFVISDAQSKLQQLAEATPEPKYGYRPSKEARSTGEVFMHVAAANYGIPSFAGVQPPAGFNFETYEKSLTKKADILKALQDSFTHALQAFEKMSDADLDKPVSMFGHATTVRGAYLIVLSHAHEHLGQSIAHARANKIAPPWTEKMNQAAKKAKEAGK